MQTNLKRNLFKIFILLLLIGAFNLNTGYCSNAEPNQGNLKLSEIRGEYFPKENIVIGDYLLVGIVLDTDYLEHMKAFVCFRSNDDPGDDTKAVKYTCTSKINGNKLDLALTVPKEGAISIYCGFLPRQKEDWQEIYNATAFFALITVKKNGKIIYSQVHPFKYSPGY